MSVPPGVSDDEVIEGKMPARALLKRIDIGLTTGIAALFLSLVGVVTSRATFKMNQETQKARVLPIIDIDMGYEGTTANDTTAFVVRLTNVGAGLAHVQRVQPLKDGEPIANYQDFSDAVMTRRMASWSRSTTVPAAGFLRAGSSVEPRRHRLGAGARDLNAYLRGEYGPPMDGVDMEVCYCSVFDDCWTVRYLDRKLPEPVASCGIADAPVDAFQDYIDQRAAARQQAD